MISGLIRTIGRRWRSFAYPGVLALLGLGFALVPLAVGEIFFYWDNAQQHYAQTEFLHQALRSGRIPQWWPQVGAGVSTVGEGQAAHYYPIHLLLTLLFSAPTALTVEIGVYLGIAGVSTYFFLREFKLARLACLVGGLTQMFGSFSIVFVQNMALHRSFCFLPLAMLFAERFAIQRKILYGFLASLVVAMQLLAGHPTFAIVTLVATGFYIVCRIVQRSWHIQETLPLMLRHLAFPAIQWGLFAALGFGVAAIQTIPTVLHTQQSIRQGGLKFQYAVAGSLSAKIQYLPQLLFPYFFDQGQWLDSPTQLGSYFNEVPYVGVYVGALPALLAFLGIWWWRRHPDPGIPLGICCLVSTGLAMGAATPLYPALWSVPGMNGMRYPFRFLMWTSFCLACLAALGLHRLLARSRVVGRRRRDAVPFLVMSGGVILLTAALFLMKRVLIAHGVRLAGDSDTGIVISLLLLAVAFALAWAALILRRPYRGFVLALAVIFLFADLLGFRTRSGYARTVTVQEAMSPPSVVGFLKADPDQYRVMSLVSADRGLNRNEDLVEYLQADTCTQWGIDSFDVYFSLFPKRYYAVHEALIWELLNSPGSAEKLAGFLGALNVKYVLAPKSAKLQGWEKVYETPRAVTWKNPAFQPRAFLVSKVTPEDIEVRDDWFNRSTNERLVGYYEMVSNWSSRIEDAQIVDNVLAYPTDYRRTAVVANSDLPEFIEMAAGAEVHARPQEVDALGYEIKSPSPAFLVISNSYYPGWTATINGQPAKIYRTNYIAMGVAVPAGSSDVVLSFAAPGFRPGMFVSLLSLLVTLSGLSIALWPKRVAAPQYVSEPASLLVKQQEVKG